MIDKKKPAGVSSKAQYDFMKKIAEGEPHPHISQADAKAKIKGQKFAHFFPKGKK